ncbi:MAG: hypothetical protein JXR64_08115 [Spirochaetales bacterium]|nr:hypothetical protein [Spirochaetales bacterium]
MKQHLIELGLTSLDRLQILKDRVFISINEYETLLKSINKSFKNKKSGSIPPLLKHEVFLMKTLEQRVRVFKAQLKSIKKHGELVIKIESEVYNALNGLYKNIDNFQNELKIDKSILEKEIFHVKKLVKPLGRLKDETAQRIDIIT